MKKQFFFFLNKAGNASYLLSLVCNCTVGRAKQDSQHKHQQN